MTSTEQTTMTLLTPPGRGAIATLAVCGPQAVAVVQERFRGAAERPFFLAKVGEIRFGRWLSESGIGEELVVARRAPNTVEIHCHGGKAAVEAIAGSLESLGVQWESPAAWALNEEPDRIAAEARLAMAEARSELVAEHLLAQYHGALRTAVEELLALVESGNRDVANAIITEMMRFVPIGMHLTKPWRVALVGEPNVGKSCLMNALLGYARSIVFAEPGTTRDAVTAATLIEGWPVEFIDTAGLRATADAVEAAGVRITEQLLNEADLLLLVADASQAWPESYDRLLASTPTRTVIVFNKIDLEPHFIPTRQCQVVSAQHGTGMNELLEAIIRQLVPEPPPIGTPLIFNERQWQLMDAVHAVIWADAG